MITERDQAGFVFGQEAHGVEFHFEIYIGGDDLIWTSCFGVDGNVG